MAMTPKAKELHRKRTLTGRAWAAKPKPFKWARGAKVADWIPSAITAVWAYVFYPWRFHELEKINNPIRTKSLERRIAIGLLTQLMIHCKDTLTLWVAYPDPEIEGEFIGRGVDYLVEQTGLTLCAVQGALKDMEYIHLIETFPRRKKLDDGNVVPTTAIRLVRTKLFDIFGIAHLMKEARKAACNKLINWLSPLIESGESISKGLVARFGVAQRISLDPALEVSPTSALLFP